MSRFGINYKRLQGRITTDYKQASYSYSGHSYAKSALLVSVVRGPVLFQKENIIIYMGKGSTNHKEKLCHPYPVVVEINIPSDSDYLRQKLSDSADPQALRP